MRFHAILALLVSLSALHGAACADELAACCTPPPCGCEVMCDPCGADVVWAAPCCEGTSAPAKEPPKTQAPEQLPPAPAEADQAAGAQETTPAAPAETERPAPQPEPAPTNDTSPMPIPGPAPDAGTSPPGGVEPTPPVEDIFGSGAATPAGPPSTGPAPTAPDATQPGPTAPTSPTPPASDDIFGPGAASDVLGQPGGWASGETRQWSDASGRHACSCAAHRRRCGGSGARAG